MGARDTTCRHLGSAPSVLHLLQPVLPTAQRALPLCLRLHRRTVLHLRTTLLLRQTTARHLQTSRVATRLLLALDCPQPVQSTVRQVPIGVQPLLLKVGLLLRRSTLPPAPPILPQALSSLQPPLVIEVENDRSISLYNMRDLLIKRKRSAFGRLGLMCASNFPAGTS